MKAIITYYNRVATPLSQKILPERPETSLIFFQILKKFYYLLKNYNVNSKNIEELAARLQNF